MIINVDYLKTIRPIYDNTNDERIIPYIDEAEKLFVLPLIGAKLYKEITTNPLQYTLLLDGGYYNNDECYLNGLKKAVAYLAYSRFVQNNQINATTYGVDYLQSEYSEKVNTADLTYQRNQAKEIGLQYLEEVKQYLSFIGKESTKQTKTKIQVIEWERSR